MPTRFICTHILCIIYAVDVLENRKQDRGLNPYVPSTSKYTEQNHFGIKYRYMNSSSPSHPITQRPMADRNSGSDAHDTDYLVQIHFTCHPDLFAFHLFSSTGSLLVDHVYHSQLQKRTVSSEKIFLPFSPAL